MPASVSPRRYRGTRYWETEHPRTARTGKVALAFFPIAHKLQVSFLWRDQDSGKLKPGKTVVLDAADLATSPEAVRLLHDFVAAIRS